MEVKLRRALDVIARDRSRGAAELALEAIGALDEWLLRERSRLPEGLQEIVRALIRAQPAMAPILRLANDVALTLDHHDPPAALRHTLSAMRGILHSGPQRIARRLAAALPHRRRLSLLTYSYSSTVAAALCQAGPRTQRVICSEGRPACEGRKTARTLARAGIPVRLMTDAALFSSVRFANAVLLGADQVRERSFVNKIGTETIVRHATEAGKRVWILADTTKFLPAEIARTAYASSGKARPAREIWQDPPRGVSVSNYYFETVRYRRPVRLLTERGWMTPARVRRELARIRVSPRLRGLLD